MAKKKAAKNPGGRPKAEINWDEVGDLLKKGCSGADIAASIGVDDHTLYDRCQSDLGLMFSAYSQQMKAKGDAMIHKAQFESAVVDKDKAMLIWLGKQRLGQRDKSEVETKNLNIEMTREEREQELAEILKKAKK